jgi:predicted phage tail protein
LADNGPGTDTHITPGEVYTYLRRSVVVEGLEPGTQYYFWVEAIDTVGNSSGVQRVGSHTIESSGVLWEFEVSVDANNDILAYWIESDSFDINANNLYLENWIYMNEDGQPPRDNSEYIEVFADSKNDSNAYGDIVKYEGTTTMWTIRDTRPNEEIFSTQLRVK